MWVFWLVLAEQYCAVHGNYSALNCNSYLKLFMLFFSAISCASNLIRLIPPHPPALAAFVLSDKAGNLALAPLFSLILQVQDPRAEEKVDEELGLLWSFAYPQESFCSLSLQQWKRGSREEAVEWLKYWQSSWRGGDAGLLTCLGQTIIQGKTWRWLVWGGKESLYQGY